MADSCEHQNNASGVGNIDEYAAAMRPFAKFLEPLVSSQQLAKAGGGNTRGEVTSQNLWPRYDRHFVGVTWHNVWS